MTTTPRSRSESGYRVIGTRPVRPDGVDKVTGRARYGADINLPGMLYGRVKRSPHAHARLLGIDASKALALPGVLGVVTYEDLPLPPDLEELVDLGEGAASSRWIARNVFARERVLYVGHAVAAVCATDPHIAEDALDLIEVQYEPLEPVLDVREAMLPSAPLLHEDLETRELPGTGTAPVPKPAGPSNIAQHVVYEAGDVASGFDASDVIVEREFRTTMAHQGYLEPHNGTAQWGADGSLTLWTSTQGPFVVRAQLALLLGLPLSKVRVVPMEIGGGFGGKIPVYMEPMAALLSKQTGRPVKMIMTREEVLQATGPTSGTHVTARIGATRDGRIQAADVRLAFEAGAFPSSPMVAGAMCALGPYEIENLYIEGWDVVVNKPKVAAYRAPGAPQTEFAVESVVDELAERLELDPMEFRRRNAAKQGSRRVDGQMHREIGNLEVMEAITSSDHYRSELQGEYRGRGVAMGFWGNAGMESSAFATVRPDATVSLVVAAVDIGGTRASLAMQLAETLGIDFEQVKPSVVDTESVGYTAVTGGSRTSFATGWAVYEAAMDLRRQMAERAAQIWEIDPSAVRYDDDGVIRGPAEDGAGTDEREMAFAELAGQLPLTGGMLQGHADVAPSEVGVTFAGHIVDVEVDPQTGKVEVLRYTAAQDVGTAIHPSYVEGQIQGGVAQGVGMALTEGYQFTPEGRMQNTSLLDYRMPTALDLPAIETILVEVPNPGHPYGVRGVGEVPIVPPLAAVANAIHDALGVRVTNLPATPGAILEELEAARGS